MKIAIVTDAWSPQVNGVVTTLQRTRQALERRGLTVDVVSPGEFWTVPCPTYPEIRLALWPGPGLARRLDAYGPDAVHIATEGPLGAAARRYCTARRLAFTTSYHTQFPQYVRKRVPIPEPWSYAYLRLHHNRARRTLVATEHQRRDLVANGFNNVVIWSRASTGLFKPMRPGAPRAAATDLGHVGRVAIEESPRPYSELDLPGREVVVDGPDRAQLAHYPRRGSWATSSARTSLAACRRPTSSSSRAARTPSAW
jgi:hypothetical protein